MSVKKNIKETLNTPKASCNCTCQANEPSICEAKAPIKRVQIVGNAYVLTSTLSLDVLKKVEKYANTALCIIKSKNNEETELFRISTGKIGSISKCGIVFAEANKDGKAIVTTLFPENVANKREYIKENFINIFQFLSALENSAERAYEHLSSTFANIDEMIEEI